MSRLLSSLSFRILIVRFQRQLIPMFHSFPNDAIPLSLLTYPRWCHLDSLQS